MLGISTADSKFDPDSIRASLENFWKETFKIDACPDGYILSLPLMRSDGLQLVIYAQQMANKIKLTDRGDILSYLDLNGINLANHSITRLIQERCKMYNVQQNGLEFYINIDYRSSPENIQIFAEALASISHIIYKHEIIFAENKPAYTHVGKILQDLAIEYSSRKRLETQQGRNIEVDYYVPNRSRAVETFSQKNRQMDLLEIWAYRWMELKNSYPGLKTANVYDEETFQMTPEMKAVANSHCDLLCPSHKTDEIASFLLS